VGKKTAERIVVELKDRMPRSVASATPGEAPPAMSLRDDLLSALINLGYHRPLVEKAVDASLKRRTDANFEQHLRDLLRELA